jgi:hypothetical protein
MLAWFPANKLHNRPSELSPGARTQRTETGFVVGSPREQSHGPILLARALTLMVAKSGIWELVSGEETGTAEKSESSWKWRREVLSRKVRIDDSEASLIFKRWWPGHAAMNGKYWPTPGRKQTGLAINCRLFHRLWLRWSFKGFCRTCF